MQPARERQWSNTDKVAPYVGAWIETIPCVASALSHMSHPMWVRGLKPFIDDLPIQSSASHPMWVRGLKQRVIDKSVADQKSHPMWVRGLKPHPYENPYNAGNVAPYVGAWIETRSLLSNTFCLSVAPYVGAWIETFNPFNMSLCISGRTLCGCVD